MDHISSHRSEIYARLFDLSQALAEGLRDIFQRRGRPVVVQHVGPLLSLFLTKKPAEKIIDYRQAREICDAESYISLQHALQRSGVYFHPNQLEPMFLSTSHSEEDISIVLERFEYAAKLI